MTITATNLLEEARRRQLDIEPLGWRGAIAVRSGASVAWLFGSITHRTSHLGVLVAGDKRATKLRLSQHGLPSVPGQRVDDEEAAVSFWRHHGGPVVLKPSRLGQGRGVRAGLSSEARVRAGFQHAAAQGGPVLVEQHIAGHDLRILVVDGRVAAAVERTPAHVVGDGRHSVFELIAAVNAARDAGVGARPVEFDACLGELLANQQMTLATVPPTGRSVALRSVASFSRGGTAVDITDDIDDRLAALAVAAAAAVELDVAGVDLIVPDLANPRGAVVLEVNASPGLDVHLAAGGAGASAAGAIFDYLLPGSGGPAA